MKVLMVCLGNICRSPLAEGVLKDKAKKHQLNWVIESAGTNGLHNGEAPHPLSQKVALQHGIDIRDQVSRRCTATDFDVYDKIYVMADDVMHQLKQIAGKKFDVNKVDYFLNELQPNSNAALPDPWYGNEDGYIKVYDIINKTCDAIIEKYK